MSPKPAADIWGKKEGSFRIHKKGKAVDAGKKTSALTKRKSLRQRVRRAPDGSVRRRGGLGLQHQKGETKRGVWGKVRRITRRGEPAGQKERKWDSLSDKKGKEKPCVRKTRGEKRKS